MLDHPLPDIDSWTLLFNSNSLPILRVTKRRLDEMRADLDRVGFCHICFQSPNDCAP